MNSKQFAWAYLVKFGKANLEPSFYGGYDPVWKDAPFEPDPNWKWDKSYGNAFIKLIKQYRVNWTRTQSPESESFRRFTDTFHDSEEEEFLVGTLVLTNGTKLYYSGKVEVSNVFDMMAKTEELVEFYKEVFGDE